MKKYLYLLASSYLLFVSCSENTPKETIPLSITNVTDADDITTPINTVTFNQWVKINGSGFKDVTAISVQGTSVDVGESLKEDSSLTFKIPVFTPTLTPELTMDISVEITNPDGSQRIPLVLQLPNLKFDNPILDWVLPNNTMTIAGKYFDFYNITKTTGVLKINGVKTPFLNVTDSQISFVIPAGTMPGAIITIESPFFPDTPSYTLKYMDVGVMLVDFDDLTKLWGTADRAFVVTEPSGNDAPALDGNYVRFNTATGDYVSVGAGANFKQTFTADMKANPQNYSLRFEVNTKTPIGGAGKYLYFGFTGATYYFPSKYGNDTYTTDGKWETVTVNLETVFRQASATGNLVMPTGYTSFKVGHNGKQSTPNFCVDNVRIVANN